jgi:glutathione S-transferase
MALELFGHPFSSYTWKALIPLWEKDVPFEFRILDAEHPENGAEFAQRSPTGKFPLLADGRRSIFEATSIIEYLEVVAPKPSLIPKGQLGVEARMLDRLFDNYVMNAMQRLVDVLIGRAPESETAKGRAILDKSYTWLDANLGKTWAVGESFTMADCAAAPSLFYADWVHPIPHALGKLKAYRARLLSYPAVARAVDGARPYRHFFPGGAPDRD